MAIPLGDDDPTPIDRPRRELPRPAQAPRPPPPVPDDDEAPTAPYNVPESPE